MQRNKHEIGSFAYQFQAQTRVKYVYECVTSRMSLMIMKNTITSAIR
jgi:hypothetical protein